MRNRDCPACGRTVPRTGLHLDTAAPKSLTASWPRFRCPQCGVELRVSSKALLPALALFVAGLPLLLGSAYLPEPLVYPASVLGTALLLLCVLCAQWLHRWEVVPDD
jgi:predicted RNA-binding Zn-ribbon protein involved in translation (DUF1610 family)